jgi:hypothetical protein
LLSENKSGSDLEHFEFFETVLDLSSGLTEVGGHLSDYRQQVSPFAEIVIRRRAASSAGA